MPEVAQATITVTPVMQGAQQTITKDLTDAAQPAGAAAGKAAGASMSEAISKKMNSAGTAMTKGLTAPIAAVGAASVAAWRDVDAGLDTIVQKTGASGEALEDMHGILNNLATSIPTDFASAAAAIGEVNTRFGLTGQELEDLSAQFLKFADLNGTDVSGSIDSVQAAMAAFGLEAEDAADVLDILNKAGHDTGVPMDKLAQSLLTNSTALQEMGFGINTSTGFLANLEKSGVDSSAVMTGLKKALQNATKDGVSMSDALADLQEQMANASTDTEAAQAAMELFGAKAGPAIAAAVEDGRLSFDELSNTVTDWGDSVSTTFDNTKGPMDDFQTTLNAMKVLGADLVEAAAPLVEDILERAVDGIGQLTDAWNGLSPEMQETIIKVAGIAAVAGPLLVIGGKVIGGITAITGGIGGLIGKVGGLGSAAGGAAPSLESAGGAFINAAAGAIKMIAAAAALYIAAQAINVLVDAAIRITDEGGVAIGVLAGMAVGIGVLMGVAAACGPALTAGAVGIAVFGASLLAIGEGVNLACTGVAKVTDAVGGLVEIISANAPEINSIVTNIGETVDGTVTTISDGITSVIDAISGGISGVLDSVAGIFKSMGDAALNAGTGFEKLAGAVISLTKDTSILDLGATLGATAKGVGDINAAASGAGTSATQIRGLTVSFTDLNKSAKNSTKQVVLFGTSFGRTLVNVNSAIRGAGIADSMAAIMTDTYTRADSALDKLEDRFENTTLSFEQHIKVPHFSMSGSFNAETGSTPTVSTSWYDKATSTPYLFRNPTIFGAGEAHDEILYGRENLLDDIRDAVGGGGTNVYVTVNGAENPEDWAIRFAKEFKLQARTA